MILAFRHRISFQGSINQNVFLLPFVYSKNETGNFICPNISAQPGFASDDKNSPFSLYIPIPASRLIAVIRPVTRFSFVFLSPSTRSRDFTLFIRRCLIPINARLGSAEAMIRSAGVPFRGKLFLSAERSINRLYRSFFWRKVAMIRSVGVPFRGKLLLSAERRINRLYRSFFWWKVALICSAGVRFRVKLLLLAERRIKRFCRSLFSRIRCMMARVLALFRLRIDLPAYRNYFSSPYIFLLNCVNIKLFDTS